MQSPAAGAGEAGGARGRSGGTVSVAAQPPDEFHSGIGAIGDVRVPGGIDGKALRERREQHLRPTARRLLGDRGLLRDESVAGGIDGDAVGKEQAGEHRLRNAAYRRLLESVIVVIGDEDVARRVQRHVLRGVQTGERQRLLSTA